MLQIIAIINRPRADPCNNVAHLTLKINKNQTRKTTRHRKYVGKDAHLQLIHLLNILSTKKNSTTGRITTLDHTDNDDVERQNASVQSLNINSQPIENQH